MEDGGLIGSERTQRRVGLHTQALLILGVLSTNMTGAYGVHTMQSLMVVEAV